MLRTVHAGVGRVRSGVARTWAALGRPFEAFYLRPIIFTTDPERVEKSAYWWGLVERQGIIIRRKGMKYAPRKIRRRWRRGKFLARYFDLQLAHKASDWREETKVEKNKWALSLKAIVYSWKHPKAEGEIGTPIVERPQYDITTGEYTSRVVKIPKGKASKPENLPGAIEVAWAEMTPAEKRKANRVVKEFKPETPEDELQAVFT